MQLILKLTTQALQRAHLRQNLIRKEVDTFKANLSTLFQRVEIAENNNEHEDNFKNIVSDFLKETYYKGVNEINTNGRYDLVIHKEKTANSPVSVIFEVKRPTNNVEMISAQNPNAKALQELLHYFLQESFINENKEIKHLIITNVYEWYIFDAVIFEKIFFENKQFIQQYKSWKEGKLGVPQTDWLYQNLLKSFIDNQLTEIPCAYFNLKDYKEIVKKVDEEEDKKLISLYKIFSSAHLLKHSFVNDANTLNKEFYFELLHILGLEEVKDGAKKIIRRKKKPESGSLIENVLQEIIHRKRLAFVPNLKQYGDNEEEQLFSISLELCITWLNRILFLKLLEGQMIKYSKNNLKFLHYENLKDFDELNELFFDVLAIPVEERNIHAKTKFSNLPYLNSSLFDETELEANVLSITGLKNRLEMNVYAQTVLKDAQDKKILGRKNTLEYLFHFLNSFDFSGDSEEIQSDNKTLINSAVLGLIFEKINGYKDGSFFTPAYITMYMCRETIRKAVVQKFNEKYKWNCADFENLKSRIDFYDNELRKEANEVVNSVKVCDPSVGSGHFLVSALNELVAIKSELNILCHKDGTRIREYAVELENDEILITDKETNKPFAYRLNQNNVAISDLQMVQEAIFSEKKIIIENCLFGVDINPKSVAICRLRLWIELLKNMYYTKESKYTNLETLPNIDINIKWGNSLISRFGLGNEQNLLPKDRLFVKKLIDDYKIQVFTYKSVKDWSAKNAIRQQIARIKSELEKFVTPNDKDFAELRKKEAELGQIAFAFDEHEREKQLKLTGEVSILRQKYAEKQQTLYRNTLEWRFDFPEVLDEEGNFVGFDVVVANPPYMVSEQQVRTYEWATQNYNTYVAFVQLAKGIGNQNAQSSFIIPSTWLAGNNYSVFRKSLITNKNIVKLIQLPYNIFDVYVDTLIAQFDFNSEQESVETHKFDIHDKFDNKLFFNKIHTSEWENDDNYTIFLDKRLFVFLNKYKTTPSYQLKEIAEIQRGTLPPQESDLKSVRVSENDIEWFNGQIYRYVKTQNQTCFVDYSILKENKPIALFQTKKILARQLVSRQFRLQFHYIETEFAFKKNLYAIYNLKEGIHYLYLLAVLNSRFFSFIQINFNTGGQRNDFPAFSLKDFREFLIPKLNETEQQPFIVLAERILNLKNADKEANTKELEAQIDNLVYKLYDLTEAEIAIIEAKI